MLVVSVAVAVREVDVAAWAGEMRGGDGAFGGVRGGVLGGVPEWGGDAQVAEQDGAVVVDEEIGRLDVAVDEAVYVQVAAELR